MITKSRLNDNLESIISQIASGGHQSRLVHELHDPMAT
jgi:hypothetical protein